MAQIKYDLNNSMVQELVYYQELMLKIRTTTGNPTFTSTSSSQTYTISNNTGEAGMLLLLQSALSNYMITASNHNSLIDGSYNYSTATHLGANAYQSSPDIGLLSLNNGYTTNIKFDYSNTGSSTLNIDGLGVKTIKKITLSGKVNIDIGDIVATGVYTFIYDGVNFIILNPSANNNQSNYSTLNSTGTDTYAVSNTIPFRSYATGMNISFKPDIGNIGACTINVDGLGVKSIKKNVTLDLVTGDIGANQIANLIYDGTNFQLMNPNSIDSSIITAAGDMIYGSAANTPAKRSIGSDGQVLGVSSGLPAWETKFNAVKISGNDGSTTIPSGAFNKTIALGISAKVVFLTLYASSGSGPFVNMIITSAGYQVMHGTSSAAYYASAQGAVTNYSQQNSANPFTGDTSFSSASISGTDLSISFHNASGSTVANFGWKIVALA